MPTVRCFQMRLSVSSVSYSSTQPGEPLREIVDGPAKNLAILVQSLQCLGVLDLADLVLRHAVRQIAGLRRRDANTPHASAHQKTASYMSNRSSRLRKV